VAKIAILSDIHANLEALQAVLKQIRDESIEKIYCLGDVIGYGPNPRECIDLCLDFHLCILGNHDIGALFDPEGFSSGAENAIFWTRSQLEDNSDPRNEQRWNFLCELSRTHREGELLFVHGSARSPLTEYVFPDDVHNQRKMQKIFGLIQHYCFQGHTHVPGVFTDQGRFLVPSDHNNQYRLGEQKVMINVGSVGQPRDGNPLSSYVVLEDEMVQFRRCDYDRDTTIEKIYAIPQLDNSLGDRLRSGR
jgi:predicted phosphodiesterase